MKDLITTHVLDTAAGRPAAGVVVTLFRGDDDRAVGSATTDDDGRVMSGLCDAGSFAAGTYRIRFETGDYLYRVHGGGFYPAVEIAFVVAAGEDHYHVPLLLSPHGYSTYRGS